MKTLSKLRALMVHSKKSDDFKGGHPKEGGVYVSLKNQWVALQGAFESPGSSSVCAGPLRKACQIRFRRSV
jgi:hypothetical protein